jgi:ABC-2 type transport system ATP-binding protein
VIKLDGAAQLAPKLLRSLDDAHIEVASVEVVRPTLDDVFLNLTGRSLREDMATTTTATTGDDIKDAA